MLSNGLGILGYATFCGHRICISHSKAPCRSALHPLHYSPCSAPSLQTPAVSRPANRDVAKPPLLRTASVSSFLPVYHTKSPFDIKCSWIILNLLPLPSLTTGQRLVFPSQHLAIRNSLSTPFSTSPPKSSCFSHVFSSCPYSCVATIVDRRPLSSGGAFPSIL